MATIESLDLAGLQYNPDDVAAALADLLTVNGVTLTDIITSLESSSATQLVSKYNSSTNVLDNINLGANVTGKGSVKFVSPGKPAINLSGTAGVDFPDVGHTWVCFAMHSGYWNSASSTETMGFGFGQPALILTNDGTWSASPPTAWVSRDMFPDTVSTTVDADIDKSFSSGGSDGFSGSAAAGSNFIYTLDYENLN
jgi:hypothetical protein